MRQYKTRPDNIRQDEARLDETIQNYMSQYIYEEPLFLHIKFKL